MFINKKKIIIISIIVCAVVILGVATGIIINKINIKKENERIASATLKANTALENYINAMSEKSDTFDEIYLFGYTFIVDMGNGYSDYVFMYEKTGKLDLKGKVNYDADKKTILNKDKTEYLLLTPMGTTTSILRYTMVETDIYNTENVYIYYGTEKLGFNTNNDLEEDINDDINDEQNDNEDEEIPEDPIYFEN